MGLARFKKQTAASVPIPESSDYVALFIDSDTDILSTKDASGTVTAFTTSGDLPATINQKTRQLVITNSFTSNEVITLSSGAGASSGTSIATGDSITLPASSSAFNQNINYQVYLNGRYVAKNIDVVWDSTGSFHFTRSLDIDDEIIVIGA